MYINDKIFLGKGLREAELLLQMANRHGLIAGATGTGKTITLKVLAESFSDAGVPVFLADVKGDLSGFLEAGVENEKIKERLNSLEIENFKYNSYPTIFWDVFGENGLPVRTTVSEMGPILLSRLLDLNDTQSSVLSIIFRIADDMGMLLLDYKDLKEMIQYVSNNISEFKSDYGNISSSSIGAIFRKIIAFEEEGANIFFGEEALDIRDLMNIDFNNKGNINILNAQRLYSNPKLYSTFLLWLISELFEELPEIGDADKPKLVFFFDEAHLLFDNAPKVLLEKIEQVVRLIRSKGVGIYFITQNPSDIPDDILGQLGNKFQHALRAFTPKEQKSIRVVAQSFRNDGSVDIEKELTMLKVGQALVSCLDVNGSPSVADIVTIIPPSSKIGVSDLVQNSISHSPLREKYNEIIDRESAYEILKRRIETDELKKEKEEVEKLREKEEKKKQISQSSKKDTLLETGMKQITRSIASQFGRQIGKELMRGLFGSISKK